MKFSEYFIPTLKENPSDAEVVSHKFMLRAGMIRKVAAGIYDYLPLGLKMIRKIENIVRDEMNSAGAVEILMPAVVSAELWQESGRWDIYGKELLRLKDRNNRDFCIGPTHEEVVTDLVRREIKSYKQLPINLYQIQTKFRDEVRPRFGVMRGREFIMKDGYSFDASEEMAELSYKKMYQAYVNIFTRCGLDFKVVEADSGAIGGNFSHEFMVLAQNGEDAIAGCSSCSYGANVEKATVSADSYPKNIDSQKYRMEEVYTPDLKSIDDLSSFLKISPDRIVKTVILSDGQNVVALLIRGDFEVNLIKVKNFLGWDNIFFASESIVKESTGSDIGFIGPVNIKCRVIADFSVKNMVNFVVGANKVNFHLKNVNFEDIAAKIDFADLRNIVNGDKCPKCGKGVISIFRGIEVGHIFKLGVKYSEKMNALFLDKDGKQRPFIMGCYGIGIGRTAAAAIEQNFDEDGMILPKPISPFDLYLLSLDYKDTEVREVTDKIYTELKSRGVDVLLDDRDERAGVKFKDADLLGFPYRVTIGKKNLQQGKVEFKNRKDGTNILLSIDEVIGKF